MIWFFLWACSAEVSPPVASPPPTPTAHVDPVLGRLRAKRLDYTRHGRCRMTCRNIREAEVEQILREGRVDRSRTRMDGECPSYAVEGTTEDGQRVRIVYADCPAETRVVTAIDLGEDWPCDCP